MPGRSTPDDLERLAIAAYLTGRPGETDEVGARAHLGAIRDGDLELGVRAAISLGMSLMQRGEMAQAGGWLARAARLMEEQRIRWRRARPAPDPGRACER